MGWASRFIDLTNVNASTCFYLYSDCVPKPELYKYTTIISKYQAEKEVAYIQTTKDGLVLRFIYKSKDKKDWR
jgi:hypothetical protein